MKKNLVVSWMFLFLGMNLEQQIVTLYAWYAVKIYLPVCKYCDFLKYALWRSAFLSAFHLIKVEHIFAKH